jgi:cytochrome c553
VNASQQENKIPLRDCERRATAHTAAPSKRKLRLFECRAAKRLEIAAVFLAALAALAGTLVAQNSGATAEPSPGATNSKSTGAHSPSGTRTLPFWAYPVLPLGAAAPPSPQDDGRPKHLPGSPEAFTIAEIGDRFNVADWFPGTHPAMPDVVVHGRKAGAVQGCGYCHLPNGQGHPQNASVAGLPAAYLEEQVGDFKSGMRKSSEPRFNAVIQMIQIADGLTSEETKNAGEYFASMKYRPWIRVVETARVPKTVSNGSMLLPAPGGGTEPIGDRVIEIPEHAERTELRDPTSSFVAYVPPGSIKRGEVLVTTGGSGKTIPCKTCHGNELKGLQNIPSIAGRSPSQIARQLIDIQTGARNGPNAQLMKPVVGKLGDEDIVAITAYLASQIP